MSPSERQRSHAASLLALAPDHPDPHGRRPRPRRPRSPRPNRPLRPDAAQRRAARGAAARLPRSASGMSERPRLVGINHVALVDYRDVQFTKAATVLEGMGLDELAKRPQALRELRDKGLA